MPNGTISQLMLSVILDLSKNLFTIGGSTGIIRGN